MSEFINGKIKPLNSEIIDYDENNITINANFPSHFKIVSAIVYQGNNQFDHCVIWIRKFNNDGWLRVSDASARSYNNLIRNLKNVYVLFLERI